MIVRLNFRRLPALLTAAVALSGLAGCGDRVGTSARPALNSGGESVHAASAWSPVLTDINRHEHRPAADPAVKAIVLVFILRDCPIANSYAPELNRLQAEYSSRGVSLVLIHADPETTAGQAREHAAEYELQPPVILDPDHTWVRLAGATKTPEAAVFSRSGDLHYRGRIDDRFVRLGQRRVAATRHDLRDALEAIVAGQPVSQPRTEAVGCFIPQPVDSFSGDGK